MMARSICVFCSSSDDVDGAFFELAAELGTLIGRRRDTLIWGGGKVGLMGEVARHVQRHGGKVVGVIPETMTDAEIAYHEADELIITRTMRERKSIMDERAEAFVVLPGGFGTLEELAEILTLKLLKYHDRPIVIVNSLGFYDPLLRLFDHFVEHRFAKSKHRGLYRVVSAAEEIYAALDEVGVAARLPLADGERQVSGV